MADAYRLRVAAAAVIILESESNRSKRRIWCREFLERRDTAGAYAQIMSELRVEDPSGFKNYCRMSATDFEDLLQLITGNPLIAGKIVKANTPYRRCIKPEQRLAVTLRYLATGETYTSLQYSHRISKQSISEIVPEVCSAIIQAGKPYMKVPNTETEWKIIAEGFRKRWNYQHCIGALDGKHIALIAPAKSGSQHYNYKGFHSIILLALVDSEYNFLYVDIGCQGRVSDATVFTHSSLCTAISGTNNVHQLNLPPDEVIVNTDVVMSYHCVADDAFPLSLRMMKPFKGTHLKGSKERIFNYRLSRARRVVENTFGILTQVFRVLRNSILLEPKKVTQVALTCCTLHNMLRKKNKISRLSYSPPGSFDVEDPESGDIQPGSWRASDDNLCPLQRIGRNSPVQAKTMRESLANYYVSNEGSVPWQWNVS